MLRKIILMLFLASISMNCTAQTKKKKLVSKKPIKKTMVAKSTISKEKSDLIYLNEGENIFLKEQQMNVTFKKVTEDSRCPKGTNCIVEGAASVDLELMGTYTRPVTVTLSTLNRSDKGYLKYAVFNGYKITLEQVNPYPEISKGFKENLGKYKIAIQIEKIADVDPTGTTTK